MHSIRFYFLLIACLVYGSISCQSPYTFPSEEAPHEGTWLQWPHQFEYGTTYRNRLDPSWVAMTAALVQSEKVHIIAYNTNQQTRIENLLSDANVPMDSVDFFIMPTNDVWVRDNGPIYVQDNEMNWHIQDWGFNGWGGDYNFELCNEIPELIGNATNTDVIDLNASMTIEGGGWEMDGQGVFLATRTSILSQSNSMGALSIRNPGMSQLEAEEILADNLNVEKFIWLDGYLSYYDVTDAHVDGFSKFANGNTLVTMNEEDLQYWELSNADINDLFSATNANDEPYNLVYLPLTQNDVVTAYGSDLGYKGSYVNYYVANSVVLVPNYDDPHDDEANAIIQNLYPNRTVIGIDVRNLYENGGMVHCVTQQQPRMALTSVSNTAVANPLRVYPTPANTTLYIQTIDGSMSPLTICDALGKIWWQSSSLSSTPESLDVSHWPAGMYLLTGYSEQGILHQQRLQIVH
jgi:agmatine deiminase